MLKISVREFQLHQSKYMKQLPIILTRHNLEVAVIMTVDEAKKYLKKENK